MISAPHDHLYRFTRSICPGCDELVPGAVIARDGQVFVTRECPQHGRFDGLICSDRAWYEGLDRFDVPGARPSRPRDGLAGCPEECGLCPAHQQLAGTAAIEISNRCNLSCPSCLADNTGSFELSVDEVGQALDALLRQQDFVDTLTLSGGEPTLHPQLFEILARVDRPEVGRIVINSNGLRIARDDAFVAQLALHPRAVVCLHYDGPGARSLRGVPRHLQQRALDRLCAAGVGVVPLVLAAQGVNEHSLGELVTSLLTRSSAVRSVILSMMTYAGARGANFPGDPLRRLTIAGALQAIEDGSALSRRDFMPLPMPNPLCAAIGYFLVEDGQLTPLIPLARLERVIALTKNANFGRANAEFEALLLEVIDDLYGCDDPGSAAVMAKLKRLLLKLFPQRALSADARQREAETHIKTVYLMQFMDAWSFDASRLSKCSCQHLLPGGKIIPSCGYYAYHRRFDERFS